MVKLKTLVNLFDCIALIQVYVGGRCVLNTDIGNAKVLFNSNDSRGEYYVNKSKAEIIVVKDARFPSGYAPCLVVKI